MLLYLNLIPSTERTEFERGVRAIASELQTDPDWLMQVMKAESGLSSSRRNTYSPFYKDKARTILDGYATGLLQFIPSTAREMGTTTWELEKMSNVEQLKYVRKYLLPYKGKLKSYFDVYAVVFFPAAAGKSNDDNYVFEAKNLSRSAIAKANPAININKDNKITMSEFKQYLRKTVAKAYLEKIFGNKKVVAGGGGIILTIIGGVIVYKLVTKKKNK